MSTTAQPEGTADTTLVALVLDETGSMSGTADDTRGAVNDYFEQLAKDVPSALCSVLEFSFCFEQEPTFRPLVQGVKVAEVPKLTERNYRPRGNTPLNDAVGKAIRETEGQKADRYMLIIMTDGAENASREWTVEAVNKLLAEKEQAENWTVVFLGATPAATAWAQQAGVAAGNVMAYAQTGRGVGQTMSSLAGVTATRASSPAASSPSVFADAGQSKADYEEPEGEGGENNDLLWSKPANPPPNPSNTSS